MSRYVIAGLLLLARGHSALADRPIVIAHRGASGYLPEHTREAACLAYGLQADVIEQDVVLTRDSIPIVLHDVHLDTVTNVSDVFPERARDDGRWYAIDFTWDEVQRLTAHERVNERDQKPVFPQRFPHELGHFRLATLAEMIELIQGLNRSTGRDVGIYPELKQPAWHRNQGYDLATTVLSVLHQYGYGVEPQHVYLQCFDAAELRRLHADGCRMPLIQLIGDGELADQQCSAAGIAEIAEYADGIGPPITRVVSVDEQQRVRASELVKLAHEHGLVVHPYTIRSDDLPPGFTNADQLVRAGQQAEVDGLFCDFPDQALSVLREAEDN